MSTPATMNTSQPDLQRHYIGIDPGASGGIAWSSPLGDKSAALPKTLGDFRKQVFDILSEQGFFHGISQTICYLESPPKFVKAIPGSAVFVMAQSFGRIEGVLAAFNVPTVTITPQHWQKAHGLGTRGDMTTTQWKNKLKARAQSLYPEEKVTLATADALLIFNAGCHRLI